jgi:hypothetical protein
MNYMIDHSPGITNPAIDADAMPLVPAALRSKAEERKEQPT